MSLSDIPVHTCARCFMDYVDADDVYDIKVEVARHERWKKEAKLEMKRKDKEIDRLKSIVGEEKK